MLTVSLYWNLEGILYGSSVLCGGLAGCWVFTTLTLWRKQMHFRQGAERKTMVEDLKWIIGGSVFMLLLRKWLASHEATDLIVGSDSLGILKE